MMHIQVRTVQEVLLLVKVSLRIRAAVMIKKSNNKDKKGGVNYANRKQKSHRKRT